MPLVDLPPDDEMQAAVTCIDAWVARELASGSGSGSDDGGGGGSGGDGGSGSGIGSLLIAAERQEVTDRTASQRWYLRFKGEEKDFITVWFTLRQRTLHHETQFMPAPEENVADTLAYLMRCNANLYGMWFSLGPEDAIYLVGKVPAALIDDDELDRIAGSSVMYVDDHFPTAMTLAHPTLYRRRPRRS